MMGVYFEMVKPEYVKHHGFGRAETLGCLSLWAKNTCWWDTNKLGVGKLIDGEHHLWPAALMLRVIAK
jgi:hypothetical protein